MKRFFILLFAVLLTPPWVLAKDNKLSSHLPYVPGELLVKFKDQSRNAVNNPSKLISQSLAFNKTFRHKIKSRKKYTRFGIERWRLKNAADLSATIKQLRADPNVLIVEPNYRRYPRAVSAAVALKLSDARLAQIRLDELRRSKSAINSPVVAILDDAFEIDHPDLSSNLYFPYDALNKNADPSPKTCKDSVTGEAWPEVHGTQVMGVLAAGVDNNIGINGAADNSQIIPIRLSCNYTVAAEIEALQWAQAKGANILNMSYGGPQFSELERLAIADLIDDNILLVTAAGNYQVNNDRVPDYPSGLDLPNIIAVAAVDDNNNLTNWSQYGPTSVDVAAPGGDQMIGTTYPPDLYVKTGGTSFAAPLVSGVAASLMARNPGATVYDVKAAILASAVPFADGLKARTATDGVVDAMAADALLNETYAKPVIVVKKVQIDDSRGNANGAIDPGEIIDLLITLENVWGDANSLDMTLSSTDLNMLPVKQSSSFGLKGYDSLTNSLGTLQKRFTVDFTGKTQMQGLEFTLDIRGTYSPALIPFQYQRGFTIDAGSLTLGETIQSVIRTQAQDDVHYYHVYLPSSKDSLTFNLAMSNSEITANNLDLLVNYEDVPEFDYTSYDQGISEAVSSGTKVSANKSAQAEQINIPNAAAGTYHIAVVVNANTSATNIVYTLGVETSERPLARGAVSGCVMVADEVSFFDPVLPALLFISFFELVRRYKRESR